jgi:inositol phosphorylceramide synthase catalytic subunit
VVLMAALGLLRWDHIAMALLIPTLAYAHARTKRLLVAFVGFVGVAWLYDAMRFVKNWGLTPERVLLCDLHAFEARFFGVTSGGVRMSLHDYFYVHHTFAADLFFSVPYATFIALTIGYGVYLFVVDDYACRRFVWTFFLLNVAGFVTYHLVPAAPPWYYHLRGCVVDLGSPSFEGTHLARVDAFLGVGYFHGFYGRASDIFGAIPSLHVAYPLMLVVESFRRHRSLGRCLTIFYFVWMSMAAVYLDHHWVVDVLLGWVYAALAMALMQRLMPTRIRLLSPGVMDVETEVE